MIKKWVIQVEEKSYLLCGNAITGYQLGSLKGAFRFRNKSLAEHISHEMNQAGYCSNVSPDAANNIYLAM